jgi:hypothetical protein
LYAFGLTLHEREKAPYGAFSRSLRLLELAECILDAVHGLFGKIHSLIIILVIELVFSFVYEVFGFVEVVLSVIRIIAVFLSLLDLTPGAVEFVLRVVDGLLSVVLVVAAGTNLLKRFLYELLDFVREVDRVVIVSVIKRLFGFIERISGLVSR